MTVLCASCGARVLPRSDETCPACEASLDPDAPPPSHRRVTLGSIEPLPPVCARCGSDTKHSVVLKGSRVQSTKTPFSSFPFPVRLFGFLRRTDAVQEIRRALPMCRPCAKAERPQALHMDFDSEEVVVWAHVRFEEALARIREGLDARPDVPDRYR